MGTSQDILRRFRVVIASPSDMESERATCKRVIDKVNKILKSTWKPYQLDASDQSNIRPEAGNAQLVTDKQLQIEKCQIFIGLFGYTFGSPPGTYRLSDGTLYLSGTEQEIEEAFAAKEMHNDLYPSIMLYRKIDPTPSGLTDEQIRQYAKVVGFFKECEPNGKHPAFVCEFKTGKLEELLQEHLLKTCTENEKAWLKLGDDTDPSTNLSIAENWLRGVGLKGDPFVDNLPEKIFQEEFTVDFPDLSTKQKFHLLYESPDPIYIFGERGSGKTTLLETIIAQGNSYMFSRGKKIFFVRLKAGNLDRELEKLDLWRQNIQVGHICQMIYENVENQIRTSLSRTLPELPAVNYRQPAEALMRLMDWLKKADGYTDLLCLVDEIDEIVEVRDSSNKINDQLILLKTMIMLPRIDGIRLRYFLPAVLETKMQKDGDHFRMDRCMRVHLSWDKGRLREMISQRLIATSIPRGRYKHLAQLYDGGEEIVMLDDELVSMVGNQPRGLIRLGSLLFEKHLEQRPIPNKIQKQAWGLAKKEWEKEKANFHGNYSDPEFSIKDRKPHFLEQEITLSRIPERLLKCLIQNNGELCDRVMLINAGWPDEEPSGVSEKTFHAHIGILKKQLDKVAPGWLENERGRGYRLRKPKENRGK